MFVMANFLKALAVVLNFGLTIYMWIVIIRALISWVSPDPYNPIVVFLRRATDPVLYPIRRRLPYSFQKTGIDFSPLVLLGIIFFLQYFLVETLYDLAARLR